MTDQEAYNLLSAPIRHFIREKGWTSFRPIQRAAISRIMQTDKNYILASKTASGKTEAAFLPILSKVDFDEYGVQVLYVSPLIALINDQLDRVESFCQYIDVPITKWHGEAKLSVKKQLEKNPRGILLITPESLEAMFVTHPERIYRFFSNLKYIVIDEIHYFLGSDRGIQLQSLIYRIQRVCKNRIIQIGLSATIGDFTLAKKFTGDEQNTIVLLDDTKKEIDIKFLYYSGGTANRLPLELIKEVFRETFEQKALIFPNSRARVEELAVGLKRISEKIGRTSNYFAHHASVEKRVREDIEHFAKQCASAPFSICCTSTLELGIDIGSVDKIIQIDSTFSVSSMIQRAGRSGRSDNAHAIMNIFATKPLSLVQSLSCWNLFQRGEIESPVAIERPYDVLLHQILSIVKENCEINVNALIDNLDNNPSFKNIGKKEYVEILRHLIDIHILEPIQDKLIIGIEGEHIVNNKDFYSLFTADVMFSVYNNATKIGELQPSPILRVGANIFLAAKIWTISEIDSRRMKIYVIPTLDGRPPVFISDSAIIAYGVEREMFRVLYSNEVYSDMEDSAINVLQDIRQDYGKFIHYNMPVWEEHNMTCIHPMMGTLTDDAILQLLSHFCECIPKNDIIDISVPMSGLKRLLQLIIDSYDDNLVNDIITKLLTKEPFCIRRYSKYGNLLPMKYQIEILRQKAFDFERAIYELTILCNALP